MPLTSLFIQSSKQAAIWSLTVYLVSWVNEIGWVGTASPGEYDIAVTIPRLLETVFPFIVANAPKGLLVYIIKLASQVVQYPGPIGDIERDHSCGQFFKSVGDRFGPADYTYNFKYVNFRKSDAACTYFRSQILG